MKIIISKDFLVKLFTSTGVNQKKYENFVINLLKKNYKFYISANTCLELSRLLSLENKRVFHSRIGVLCEEVLPLTFEIQKQISELEVMQKYFTIEKATAQVYGLDLILTGIPDLIHSMSSLNVAEIDLDG